MEALIIAPIVEMISGVATVVAIKVEIDWIKLIHADLKERLIDMEARIVKFQSKQIRTAGLFILRIYQSIRY